MRLGVALLHLADIVMPGDPWTAAETARAAARHLRRVGYRGRLVVAVVNLAEALLMLGDWDAAETELTQAADADGLTDHQFLACFRAWLAALRGNATAAQNVLATANEPRPPPSLRRSAGLREQSTPYHLAHGLLDYAADLIRLRDTEAAAAATGEAKDIARRLRCQPLLDRAADMTPAELRVMP